MVFCFKQKTSYEMRIIDWSSDVCSSDLIGQLTLEGKVDGAAPCRFRRDRVVGLQAPQIVPQADSGTEPDRHAGNLQAVDKAGLEVVAHHAGRSEEGRVWKECVSTCRSRGAQSDETKNTLSSLK